MAPLNLAGLPPNALVLVDTAPIIYVLEGHPRFAQRFRPLFEAYEAGALQLAVTTVTIAEVLTGPEQAQDHALALQYGEVLQSWNVVALDFDIARRAAELRAKRRLKLADAVQAASALAIEADALATHDRDFSRLGPKYSRMEILC